MLYLMMWCTSGQAYDDASVSPVVRQTLLHWAYELHEADFKQAASCAAAHHPCCTLAAHACCTPLLHTLWHPLPYCTLYTPSLHSSTTLHPSPYCAPHHLPSHYAAHQLTLQLSSHYSTHHLTTISLLTRVTTTTPAGCRLCSQGAKRVKTHGATYVPREQLSGISSAGSKKPAPTAAAQAAAEQQAKAAGEAASRAMRAKRRGAA